MYKRRRENEGDIEEDSGKAAALAGGPMRESGAEEEKGSSGSLQNRMYGCTFCKRGFASAQALGGHMNVHRRDRALKRSGFNRSPVSNHRKTQIISSNNDDIEILQPHGYKGPNSRAALYLDLSSAAAIFFPYDPAGNPSAEPSLFVSHGGGRDDGEIKRAGLCVECSSRSSETQIIDQWYKSDPDAELDLELRL